MKERKWIAVCVIVLIALLAWNMPDGASSRVKSVVRDGLSPLQALATGGVREFRAIIQYIRGLGDLVLENRALNEEIVYLRGEMHLARELAADYHTLRKLIGFIQRSPEQLISCEAIGRDSMGWWQTVRLDKGEKDGVRVDRAVISMDGLLGRTVSVSSKTCDVLLLSDPSCKVSVKVRDKNAFGVVSGTGAKAGADPVLRMDFIHRVAPVEVGEEVMTSGMGGVFPKGMTVGTIARVEMDETGLYQRAWITPAADLGMIDYAFVLSTEEEVGDFPEDGMAAVADESEAIGVDAYELQEGEEW